MADIERTRFVPAGRKLKVYGGRGKIYSWLRTHHDEIEDLLAIHRHLWVEIARDMFEDGIVETGEGRPVRERIWHIWPRVKRDVAAEAAATKRKKAPPPAVPPDWRPTIVPPPPPNWPTQRTAGSAPIVPLPPANSPAKQASTSGGELGKKPLPDGYRRLSNGKIRCPDGSVQTEDGRWWWEPPWREIPEDEHPEITRCWHEMEVEERKKAGHSIERFTSDGELFVLKR